MSGCQYENESTGAHTNRKLTAKRFTDDLTSEKRWDFIFNINLIMDRLRPTQVSRIFVENRCRATQINETKKKHAFRLL